MKTVTDTDRERPVLASEILDDDFDALQRDDLIEEISESELTQEIEEPAVISENSLSYYMQRIAGNNPLTKEQEQSLGRRIKAGDKKAFEELVNANLKFVVAVSYKYRNSGLPMTDIINQGNLGLLEAAKRYDPERGVKFISYAVWWIRQYIVQGIAEQSGTVRLPIKQASNLFKINDAREKLGHEFGREPTDDELAYYLNMKTESIADIIRVSKQSLSLETPIKEGEDRSFVDLLESKEASVEDRVFQKNIKDVLEEMVGELDPREIQIINLRFGFEDNESLTLDELGKKFGVSRERIRQLEARALDKLKKKAVKMGLQTYLAN